VPTLLVSYDALDDASARIESELKTSTAWARPLRSVWLVESDLGAVEMRDRLRALSEPANRVLVADVTGRPLAWQNIASSVSEWMKVHV
jgi:hypothetical protein